MKKYINYKYFIRTILVLFFGLFMHTSDNAFAQEQKTQRGTQISDNTAPNTLSPLEFSLLELNSTERGFLMPRMTTAERDNIPTANLAAGLTIYNTSMGCVEFYNVTRQVWMNMCGDVEPAIFTIPSDKCGKIEKNITGDYIQGVLLNERSNLITIEVSVSTPGTFEIEAIAYDDMGNENGYTFITKGVFPTSGNFMLVLKGNGTPKKGYTNTNTKDTIKFWLNKKKATCEVRNHVKPDFEPLLAIFDCSNPVGVEGRYKIDESLTSANRLVASVKVTKPGRGKVYGEIPISGAQTEVIKYESETIDFRITDVNQVQTVILSPVYGTGKPTTSGELKGKLKLISNGKHEYDPFVDPVVQTIDGCDFKINVERGTAKYKFKGNAIFFSVFNSTTYRDPIYGRAVPYITPKTNMAKDDNSSKFIVYVVLEVEQPGDYKIETNDKNGVRFFREAVIEKKDINSNGEVTIALYAKGTSGPDMRANSGNKFIAYDLFKGAVGSSPSFSGSTTDVDFVYRPMTMYSIGGPVGQSWHPGGFNGPGNYWFAGPRLVRQNKYFSWNGTVRIDALNILGITSFEQTGNGVDYTAHLNSTSASNVSNFQTNLSKADMVFIGGDGTSNNFVKRSSQLSTLATSVKDDRTALVFGEGQAKQMNEFLGYIGDGGTTTDVSNTGPYEIVSSSKEESALILGKPNSYFSIGDAIDGLNSKSLGSSSTGSTTLTNISSTNQYVNLAGTMTGSFAFVHKTYGFVGVGSGGFMGGYVDSRHKTDGYPVNASTSGDPLKKNLGGKGDVYNSWFLLNLVHWAIDYAQTNQPNEVKK